MKKYKKQYTNMSTLAFRVDNELVKDLDKSTPRISPPIVGLNLVTSKVGLLIQMHLVKIYS